MAGELTFHDNEKEVSEMLRQFGAEADAIVLVGLILDFSLWSKWRSIVCVELPDETKRNAPAKFVEDFVQPVDNAIYYALTLYNMQFKTASEFRPAGVEMLALGLDRLAKGGTVLGLSEYPIALQRVASLLNNNQTGWAVQIAGRIIGAWVQQRRMTRLGSLMASGGRKVTLKTLGEQIQRTMMQVGTVGMESRTYEMGRSLENEPLDLRPAYPLVLPNVSHALGGGVRKKDASLVIAAQGAGKTIHFLQGTADLFKGSRLKVLGITTEQEPKELELRNISREASIPMRKLSDGFDKTRLTPDEFRRYQLYLEACDKAREAGAQYAIHYWPRGQQGLHSKLRELVREAQQKWGGLDAIAVDWIGGGMELSPAVAQFYRFHMQLLADEIVAVSREEDLIGVAYTQARAIPREGYDNPRVASENMQENKSLGNNYTNILGLSGMRDKGSGDEGAETSQTFSEEQYCFISKARKGTGGLLKWSRKNFSIQKMEASQHK